MSAAPGAREGHDGSPPLTLEVSEQEAGSRLEQFVRQRLPGISRGSVQRLLEARQVLVDARPEPKGYRLQRGQTVLVAAAARSERPVPQPDAELEIIAVLPELIVINKQPGVACYPLVPGETDTVANALAAKFPECAESSPIAREGGLVHRLDASTSGVLLAARSRTAYGRLRGMFSGGQVLKHYQALVAGSLVEAGRISLPLRPMPGDPRRVMVVAAGFHADSQRAETDYQLLESLGWCSWVELRSRSGRRHQIRVHLAHLGHPLVGDALYGGPSLPSVDGAFLHASRLMLPDGVDLSAPLPRSREQVLAELRAKAR